MIDDPAVLDFGLGIRPDLAGRGASRRLMPAVLDALDQLNGKVTLRAAVKAWNDRAQHAASHAGFQITGTHKNSEGSWVILTRRAAHAV